MDASVYFFDLTPPKRKLRKLPAGRGTQIGYGSWVKRAACGGDSDVFEDLDAVDLALTICNSCPVLNECRTWALLNAVDGVAGGLTPFERRRWRTENGLSEPTISLEDFVDAEILRDDVRNRAVQSQALIDLVADWTERGESGNQIARRLNCSRRNVLRLRRLGERRAIAG